MPERGYLNTYPYNYLDELAPEIVEEDFEALVIENEFLRATVVPRLGCRLFSLFDKLAGREVFARPDPILPMPILLRGAFIPLGLEFNFPCGHSVFAMESMPCTFFDPGSGAAGIRIRAWNAVSGIDTTVEIVLRPGERLLHTRLHFENPLPVRNGFMYWANSAVTQTPEMTFLCKARMSHFFTEYNTFPFVDGLDVRVAKNRHFASDAFAVDAQQDWFGFYSPELRAGAVHIASRSQMRGQKFFSWGLDEYGMGQARKMGIDGHGYMEFQAGILETQFEFHHLDPGGEYVCDEVWFPLHDFGNVSHATEEFALTHEPGALRLTSAREWADLDAAVTGTDGAVAHTAITELHPGSVVTLNVPPDFHPDSYSIRIAAKNHGVLLEYDVATPEPASADEIAVKQAWLDTKPTTPANRAELAFRHYKARRFEEAAKLATSVDPSDREAHSAAQMLLREIAWWRENGLPSAPDDRVPTPAENPCTEDERRALEERIAHSPEDSDAHNALGNFYFGRDRQCARDHWRIAAKAKNLQAHRNLAYTALRDGDAGTALPLYRELMPLAPPHPALEAEFHFALRLAGRFEESIARADSLPAKIRDDYRVVKMRAYALCDAGRPEDTVALLCSSPQLRIWEGEVMPHKYYIDALLASGLRELAVGHFARAENAFRRMLEYPPALGHSKPLICNESIAYYHLGLVAEAMGKEDMARAWWQVAAAQDLPHGHHWVSYRENEYFGALAALRLGEPSAPYGANLSQRSSGVPPLFPLKSKGQDAASVPPSALGLPYPSDYIAERLIEGHNPQAQPAALDLPMFAQGWRISLAAARGFQLLGKPAEAGHALDLAERAWGPSWVLKHTRNSLTPSYSTQASETIS